MTTRSPTHLPTLLTLALLAVMAVGREARGPSASAAEAYFATCGRAIDMIPFRIRQAVGEDAEPTPSATRLLKPNRILQRRFLDVDDGSIFSLLIVHCKDARDMLGHYPPVCYKAHGWTLTGGRPLELRAAGRPIPGMQYSFERRLEFGVERLSVVNFFLLPHGPERYAPDMKAVDRASQGPNAALGAAQVQVVFPGEPAEGTVRDTSEAVLEAIGSTMGVITGGLGDE